MSLAGLGTMLGAGMTSYRDTKKWKDDREDKKYEFERKKQGHATEADVAAKLKAAAGPPSGTPATQATQATQPGVASAIVDPKKPQR